MAPTQEDPAKIAFEQIVASVMADFETRLREMLQPVFQAGIDVGQGRSQSAIAAAMGALQAVAPSALPAAQARPIELVTVPARRSNGGYAGVTEAVRTTLRTFGTQTRGTSIRRIQEHISQKLGRPDITSQQIRSSLKALSEHDEVVRVDRGAYTAGPKLSSGVVNGGAHSLFSQHTATQ